MRRNIYISRLNEREYFISCGFWDLWIQEHAMRMNNKIKTNQQQLSRNAIEPFNLKITYIFFTNFM